jgi:hypothetical protein
MLHDIALTCYYLAPWLLPLLAFVFIGTAIVDNLY